MNLHNTIRTWRRALGGQSPSDQTQQSAEKYDRSISEVRGLCDKLETRLYELEKNHDQFSQETRTRLAIINDCMPNEPIDLDEFARHILARLDAASEQRQTIQKQLDDLENTMIRMSQALSGWSGRKPSD